jgi:hypothetical protein
MGGESPEIPETRFCCTGLEFGPEVGAEGDCQELCGEELIP